MVTPSVRPLIVMLCTIILLIAHMQEEHPLELLFLFLCNTSTSSETILLSTLEAIICCCSTASSRVPHHQLLKSDLFSRWAWWRGLLSARVPQPEHPMESAWKRPHRSDSPDLVRRRRWTWYSWSISALYGATSETSSTSALMVVIPTVWILQSLKLLPMLLKWVSILLGLDVFSKK